MEFNLFKNQYLITDSEQKSSIVGFRTYDFHDLRIHASNELNVHQAHLADCSILLLGIALDPFRPDFTNKDITNHLVNIGASSSLEDVIRYIHSLTGRFVILFRLYDTCIAIGDACHSRQIYFEVDSNRVTVTSSPAFYLDHFELKLRSNSMKSEFVNSTAFKKSQHSWFGNKSPDDRLQKLLPNHYLELSTNKIYRHPVSGNFKAFSLSEKQIIDKSKSILTGTYDALASRDYNLIQPLTAGWDSRVLLAASKSYTDLIDYYVFDREGKEPKENQDVRIPLKLKQRFNLNFEVIRPDELSTDFIKKFSKNHIYSRILSKTENIQSHFRRYSDDPKKVINLNGNSAEILRCFYGNYRGIPSKKMLLQFSGYPDNDFIEQEISAWYKDAKKYADQIGINLLDLFYWEQRMGNWGAQFPYEQDMAIDEISPFNNHILIETLYSAGFNARKKPSHPIFKKLIASLWRDLLSEPINPDDSLIKNALKRNAFIHYLVLKLT